MRGNQNFITRTETHPDHRSGKCVAAARRQRKMLATEVLGITRLEPVAFVANAITEQRIPIDDFCKRVDLFLAYDIHDGRNPADFRPGMISTIWPGRKGHFRDA